MSEYGKLLAHDAMAFVLAGGRGSRLKELTDNRAKPAIPFGGHARIIDFTLSNALNSGFRRIAVATQYKQASLIRHIEPLSKFLRLERDGSLDILRGSEGPDGLKYYAGTAGAVFQNIDVIERYAPRHVMILAGDHIYRMDYERMLQQHAESGAAATIACLPVPLSEASGFGVMDVDAADRITAFVEKPANPPAVPDMPGHALASMGIYVFDTAFLLEQLRNDAASKHSSHDFGADIIPSVVQTGNALAHRFSASCIRTGVEESYWRDVGTIDAFFDANLDTAAARRRFAMDDRKWPLWTEHLKRSLTIERPLFPDLMPATTFAEENQFPNARISRSLLSSGTDIGSRSRIEDSVILPDCSIGAGARLRRVILDSGVRIPAGLVVGEDSELDARLFRRTQGGICLITQAMIAQLPELYPMQTAA